MAARDDLPSGTYDRNGRAVSGRVRAIVSLAIVAVVVLGVQRPAAAHGGQGAERPPASDYRTEIVSMSPAAAGVSMAVVDAGSRLELRNDSSTDVVVLGYDGDPYLRVGPDGVFENSHSTAAFLNEERFGRTSIPITANSDAEPVWRRVSSEQAVRWHDHRAHWMSETPPASVLADPTRSTQRVSEWTVPLVVDGQEVTVSGTLDWVEPPSPLWWWLVALAASGVVLLAGRRWRTATPRAASAALLVVTVLNAAGAWAATPGGLVVRSGALTVPVMMWSLLVAGMVLVRRNRVDALVLIGVASSGLAGVFGFADLGWLSSAVLPSALPEVVARATVALAIGVGSALAVTAALGAGPALVRRATLRRSATAEGSADGTESARPVAVLRWQRWLLAVPIIGIVIGIGIISSADDTSAAVDPTLAADLCSAADGPALSVDDELHVRLHQLVDAAAEADPDAAQRLSDSLDEMATGVAGSLDAAAVRSVDEALVATGEDPLDCDRS